MKKFWFTLFLLKAQLGLACEVALPEQFSLATSLQENSFFSYNINRTNAEIPYLRVFNCSKLAMTNKFLMIAFGPQNLEFSDRVGIFDFANDYRDSSCVLENSPFKKTQTFSERKNHLSEKWHYIKSCYQIQVEEESNLPLSMPKVQPGCSFERMGNQKMSFNGGFCFVKPGFGSSYLVKFGLREECKNIEGLKKLNVQVSDLETILNFYSAGDASGTSIDLTAISSLPVRLTVSPDERILRPSDDFGLLTPRFPLQYAIPDLHLGTPEAKEVGANKIQLRLPFWVDNSCEKKCASGNCQSVCDYAQPIVGNIEYFEVLKSGEKEFLTSWYAGGVAQPKFQGEISGVNFELPGELIQVGSRYHFKVTFTDPKYDFERFKNRLRSKLAELDQTIGNIGRSQVNNVPDIVSINEISRLPYINGIHGLNFSKDGMNSVAGAVATLRNYLGFKLWPPFYENVCSPTNTDSCQGIGDGFAELTMDVEVTGKNSEDQTYMFKILSVERKSELLESYKSQNPKIPQISCPF